MNVMRPGEVWQWLEDESVVFVVLGVNRSYHQPLAQIVYLSHDTSPEVVGVSCEHVLSFLENEPHIRIA